MSATQTRPHTLFAADRHTACAGYMGRLAALLLTAIVLLWCSRAAQAQAPDGQIEAHLRAGEFAPAVALARQAANPQQRDALLGRIAAAQAQAGARGAALQSAAEIGDDRTRAGAIARAGTAPFGPQGGGTQADFDALIDLITSTVQPTTWDTVGGPGSIAPFPTGVWVDPQGVLRPLMKEAGDDLAALRAASRPRAGQESARRDSRLRMISLPRLEKAIQLRRASDGQPTEAMQVLAGLYRIKYLFIYPDSGDIVLAGPAGDWTVGPEGLIVNTENSQPVVRLDDLVVVLRHMMSGPEAKFGCLINPRQEALARVQEFIRESNKRAIAPEYRKTWLEQLRSQVGRQDIEVYGLDPRTRAARVMVEADYRMKLVGMGLEEGVPGVVSYLNLIKLGPNQSPPPMGVLRWWFTLNYDAVLAARDRQAFALRGQGVKVESENERLTAEGKRIHTGESEDLNRQFAHSFTEHFDALCQKYPIYAELRNLFDLAMAGALIREEGAAQKIGWHLTCFADPRAYEVELGEAPKEVDTVINHRVINRVHIVAGVSGGVRVQPAALVKRQAIEIETYPDLERHRSDVKGKKLSADAWWWD